MIRKIIACTLGCLLVLFANSQEHSVARQWNEVLLESIRNDFARPTVHARNLFHISAAMYDVWAVYDDTSAPYLLGRKIRGYENDFDTTFTFSPADVAEAREEALSYAVYRLVRHRFSFSPGTQEIFELADQKMNALGYDLSKTSTNYKNGDPATLGNYIAESYIDYGLVDGSNESQDYISRHYEPVNPPLVPTEPGNEVIVDMNRWQPLFFDEFIDQSGNPETAGVIDFLSPEWGDVVPFSLQVADRTKYFRNDNKYWVFHDPGPPPYLQEDDTGLSDEYKWGFTLVSIWASHLDASQTDMIDISPATIGNLSSYPSDFKDYDSFYDYLEGGDASNGHNTNPITNEPYEPNMVPLGDYARVLAEFWADGPDSETPPGHWFTILNYVMDHPEFTPKFQGKGQEKDHLEYEVKAYFALGGAMHDAAISAWSVKGWYDYIRPISAIRAMAELGQSTDETLDNYDPMGIPLVDGFIEIVENDDDLAGSENQHVGKIKLYTWKGHDYIEDTETDVAGVGWILAENWWPYQRPTFVTPPFAGYVSGHSTYSSAAARLITEFTGSEYFPGGMGEFFAPKNEFLVFEDGPSVDVTLQWATYKDAADQCSLSRIWGGIHPPADDIPGRIMGVEIGKDAFSLAKDFFNGIVPPLSISTNPQQNARLFPNPIDSGESIHFNNQDNRYHKIYFYSIKGQKLGSQNLNTGDNDIQMDLEAGLYIYQAHGPSHLTSGKLLIR